MIATKNFDGSITVSAIIKGYRVHALYIGYTKREAMRRFRQEHPTKG